MLMKLEIGAGAGAHCAADEIDRRRSARWPTCRRRPASAATAASLRQTVLALRIERAAGADDHPHADDRLLVVEDHHDLQPVGQRLELIRREAHVPRGQRTRRPFGRPARCAAARTRRARARARTRTCRNSSPGAVMAPAPSPRPPDGISVMHQAVFRREIRARDPLHVGGGDVLENVELAVGGRDCRCESPRRAPAAAPSADSTRG